MYTVNYTELSNGLHSCPRLSAAIVSWMIAVDSARILQMVDHEFLEPNREGYVATPRVLRQLA